MVHWNRCDWGIHIIGCNAFPFLQPDKFDMAYKVLRVQYMMRGMSYQYCEDVSQLLGHTICDCTPVG